MKKKTLLIFLLTAVSATTVAAAAGCVKKHQHNYSWQSNAEQHWQECDDCGDRKDEGAHVDNVNNVTQAAGADGKCDVCGLEHYAVNYEMNGHGTAPSAQIIYKGGKAVQPATDPVDTEGEYVFAGWYSDAECNTVFDFNTAISADTTVYAKWEVDTRLTVTFDANGHGTAPNKQRVEAGGSAVKPADPEEDGWLFENWYADAECETLFDFGSEITEDTTVYAKWHKDLRAVITFDAQGHGTAPAVQRVELGGYIDEPADLSEDGYTFAGWYVDAECNTEYNFGDEVTSDITLYAKWTVTVTFNMLGHGSAPQTQTLTVGSKVNTSLIYVPDTVDGLNFGGWYSDENLTVLFDFDAPVTSAVTVYAKWTPGLPKLVLDKVEYVTFGSENELQFVFIAPQTGRYQIGPGNNNTFSCYFNTSLDEDGVYYGDGYASYDNYFDLSYGQEITATLYRGDGIADTTKVCLVVNEVTNEPFPAEGWESGEYSNGTITIEFVRDDSKNIRKVIWNDVEYNITSYLGGSFNTAYFSTSTYDCALKQTAEDTYLLTYGNNKATLTRVIPQEPIPVEKFSGLYAPSGTAKVDSITEICIYESGNGYTVGTAKLKYNLGEAGARYDTSCNELYYGSVLITANLDGDGNVVSINVRNISTASNPTVVYNRTKDAPEELPEKLPLPASIELAGNTLGILCSNGTQKWSNGTSIEITGYDKDSDIYTVKYGSTTYKLEIEGSGDDTVVKVYNSSDSLVDTLAKKQLQGLTLKLDGSDNNVVADDVSNYYAIFEIPQSGTYLFNATKASTTANPSLSYLYGTYVYPDYENNPSKSVYISEYNSNTKIELTAGNKFAINLAEYGSRFSGFTFTLTESTPDPGSSADNPIILQGAGSAVLAQVDDSNYYVEFTATEAGTYNITCSYYDFGTWATAYWINYTVDGVQNGYVATGYYAGNYYKNGEIFGEGKYDQTYIAEPYTTITVNEGQTVKIVLTRKNDTTASNVNVAIVKV